MMRDERDIQDTKGDEGSRDMGERNKRRERNVGKSIHPSIHKPGVSESAIS